MYVPPVSFDKSDMGLLISRYRFGSSLLPRAKSVIWAMSWAGPQVGIGFVGVATPSGVADSCCIGIVEVYGEGAIGARLNGCFPFSIAFSTDRFPATFIASRSTV